jgi:hypothetical protein
MKMLTPTEYFDSQTWNKRRITAGTFRAVEERDN